MIDHGLTHIALPVSNLDSSIAFYEKYAAMKVVHRRRAAEGDVQVAWISDGTRPFVIVLIQDGEPKMKLNHWGHLGVTCSSREEIDRFAAEAAHEGILDSPPRDSGEVVGYWTFIRDPDGHILELSYGQKVGLTVESFSFGNSKT